LGRGGRWVPDLEAVAAASFEPSYSYMRDYISDLGLTPASFTADDQLSAAYLMQIAFFVQGILFFTGALLIVGSLTVLGPERFWGWSPRMRSGI